MKKTLPQPAALQRLRQANAQKIARYRRRKQNGKAIYSVEVSKEGILHALSFRGLSKTASKKQIEEKLSQLLDEVASRWRERWPSL